MDVAAGAKRPGRGRGDGVLELVNMGELEPAFTAMCQYVELSWGPATVDASTPKAAPAWSFGGGLGDGDCGRQRRGVKGAGEGPSPMQADGDGAMATSGKRHNVVVVQWWQRQPCSSRG